MVHNIFSAKALQSSVSDTCNTSQLSLHKCSVATCGRWLPYWAAQACIITFCSQCLPAGGEQPRDGLSKGVCAKSAWEVDTTSLY